MTEQLTSVTTLSRDLRSAATTLGREEARFLVDAYYQMQKDRIRSDNQTRALTTSEEPHAVLMWLAEQSSTLEKQIQGALDRYSRASELGQWARAQKGIGPVIAAGLLAHIDVTVPTVGHIWRYAGLDPTSKWEKGQKRPHNASLKTLCWKIGESFVKVSGYDDARYGKLYVDRKEYETARNEAGELESEAERALKEKRWRADTKARGIYESGKLPPAHIHARAKRWAVKMFLAHYHEVGHKLETGQDAPSPYAIGIIGHAHWVRAE